uniref:N-acetylated alpha-linked acidic dipeptidase like 2 n=1 Tax=Sphenodon punctatus TaxID=8508 RepID=A0A8D0GWB2_SPHPU
MSGTSLSLFTALPPTTLLCKKMAYHKVNADQRAQLHSPYLDNDDLQSTALELEWDMEKELEEPGLDHFRLDGTVHHQLGNSQNTDLDLDPIQPQASPKGRFQRLQEDPDYVSHYTRPTAKSNRCSFCRILKLICTAMTLFIFGILIGYYAHTKCPLSPPSPEASDPHLYHENLKEIKAKNIEQIFRDLIQLSRKEDTDIAMKLLVQWASCGLEDVQLVNYSVLLDLPISSPNTVILKSSGECFYPSGQSCNKETKELHSQDLLYSYAAYSAKGTLEAEVIDVRYGTAADLVRIQAMTNVTNKIALLKLGQSPLLYKLSLLEEAGFGGALLYIDPCDLPKPQNQSNKAFMVSLNSGGDPSTPGYPSIGKYILFSQIKGLLYLMMINKQTNKKRGKTINRVYLPSIHSAWKGFAKRRTATKGYISSFNLVPVYLKIEPIDLYSFNMQTANTSRTNHSRMHHRSNHLDSHFSSPVKHGDLP